MKVYKVIADPGPKDPFGPKITILITQDRERAFEWARRERVAIGQPENDDQNDFVYVVYEPLEPHEWLDD